MRFVCPTSRDISIRKVRMQGADFLRGLYFGAPDRHAKMVLRDRSSTSSDLASLLCSRRNTLDRWIFLFVNEVSQNCFVFDVVDFEFLRTSRRISPFQTWQLSCLMVALHKCLLSESYLDRYTDTQWMERWTNRKVDRQIDGQIARQIDSKRQKEIERDVKTQIQIDKGRQIDRQKDI